MKKLIMLSVLAILAGGCATTTQLGNRISGTQSYVFSTAPKDVTLDKAILALKKIGFEITNFDKQGGMIIGSRMTLSLRSFFLTISLAEVEGKTKVSVVARESGAIDAWDITGYYYKYQDTFYKELKQELNVVGYDITK